MGAWVETLTRVVDVPTVSVAPRVGAWVETYLHYTLKSFRCVAPRVGAWVETLTRVVEVPSVPVAPRVGAWVETSKPARLVKSRGSLPVWERGLKQFLFSW